jgi:hypothetical protein
MYADIFTRDDLEPAEVRSFLRGLDQQSAPAAFTWMAASPANLRRLTVLRGGRGEQVYAAALADFQRRDFASLDAAFCDVANGRKPAPGRVWLERTKGASKDTDLAFLLLWLLAFGRPGLTCQVGAADGGQAGELRKAAMEIRRANPWLDGLVKIEANALIGIRSEGRADIIPADVAGSHGARPDVLVLNELSHVTRREFAENLLDNAAKIPNSLAVVATNAGVAESWQWEWRENARNHPDRWYFSTYDQPAPWLDRAEIAEAERRNSPSRFARLWRGVWVSGDGDNLPADLIRGAMSQAGPLAPAEDGWLYLAGLDLGTRHDASALVVAGLHVGSERPADTAPPPELPATTRALVELGFLMAPADPEAEMVVIPATGKVRVAQVLMWRAPKGGRVDLRAVEEAVLEAHRTFGLACLGVDPWQAELMARRLAAAGVPVELVPFVPANVTAMCQALLDALSERLLETWDDGELSRDLRHVRLVEKSYGTRLSFHHDSSGHGDAATSLALILLAARRFRLARTAARVEGPLLIWPDAADLADEDNSRRLSPTPGVGGGGFEFARLPTETRPAARPG